jgi:hypothetical protein
MGWMDALSKIGGLIGKAGPAMGAAGMVLGKQQQGDAQGRLAESGVIQGENRNAVDLYGTAQNAQNSAGRLDLDRKAFTTQNAGDNFKQALIAELLGSGGGLSMPGIPQMSDGMMDALKGDGAKAAIASFGSRARSAQDAPPSFTGGELLAPPTMAAMPEQSGGSKFADILARIAQLGGAVSPLLKKSGGGGSGMPTNGGDFGGYG